MIRVYSNSSIDFDLAVSAAPYYEVTRQQAGKVVNEIKSIVKENWRNLAKKYGISRGEIERMEPAFRICGQ